MEYNNRNSKGKKEPVIMKDNRIKAVIEDDLVALLVSLGVYDDILAAKVHCMYCNNLITPENIEAIVLVDHEIKIVCSEPQCRQKLLTGDE